LDLGCTVIVFALPLLLDPGATALDLSVGLATQSIDVPLVPPLPVLTGDVVAMRGLAPAVTGSLRIRSQMGLVNRLGPALTIGRQQLAVDVHPWVQVVGNLQDDIDLVVHGGTSVAGLANFGLWNAGAGATVQWGLIEHVDGRTDTDVGLFADSADLRVGRLLRPGLQLDLEFAVALWPDPFTLLRTRPRLVVRGRLDK